MPTLDNIKCNTLEVTGSSQIKIHWQELSHEVCDGHKSQSTEVEGHVGESCMLANVDLKLGDFVFQWV